MQTVRLFRLLPLVLVLSFSACSSGPKPPPMAKVSGKITRKGKPLPPLTVAFTAMSAGLAPEFRYSTTKTDAEGKYAIEKLAEAEYMVSIIEEAPPMAAEKAMAMVGTPQLAKYGPDSPLRTTVKGPTSEFVYDIRE